VRESDDGESHGAQGASANASSGSRSGRGSATGSDRPARDFDSED
jgi:hypothetical protein